jgi:para-aminobenzoate synthetase component 1
MNELGKKHEPFIFIIDFDFKHAIILTKDLFDSHEIKFSFDQFSNSEPKIVKKNILFQKSPISLFEYQTAFDKVKKEINQGNTYLLNLTFETNIESNLNLKDIFYISKAKYKLFFDDKFVVFSPETFIKIKSGQISSYPMKGTIDAGIENAENQILNSKKESAEHNTIVDLIRNDLNMLADDVRVAKYKYIDKIKTNYKTLLQVSSEITGKLPNNFNEHLGNLFEKLLPAGSISGAPKKKTIEIINVTETHKRNYYTGVAGYFDGKDLDSFVMIRYIEKQGNKMVFKSGGGITSMSKLKTEYQEMIDKVYIPV